MERPPKRSKSSVTSQSGNNNEVTARAELLLNEFQAKRHLRPATSSPSSQNRLLIKNGRVVNDDGMEDADVYVEDGIIK
ncbi:hypothetical protein RR48_05918 [Papilio machaon]|uniref:Uncharacterized protein n=1 Tax=Papilio machaon TaxID=76193 RepID=A0A0N1IGN8_PAPMA|nr:hypothetical protein RR48_05918 [Papilio machaon]